MKDSGVICVGSGDRQDTGQRQIDRPFVANLLIPSGHFEGPLGDGLNQQNPWGMVSDRAGKKTIDNMMLQCYNVT
jgi:hypothetical protein